MSEIVCNCVRQLREARGLSQVELAAAARLSRQSIGAIEAGRAMPAVDVALRIAAALDCQVEQLFGGTRAEPSLTAEAASGVAGRVALVQLAGRWVAHALEREGLRVSADALAGPTRAGRIRVESLRTLAELEDNVAIMGCAAALGLLTDRLNSRPGAGHFLWLSGSSTRALDALDKAQIHMAGVHLVDPKTRQANVPDVRRLVSSRPLVLITLGHWEAGLVTAQGNPKRLRSVADLGRRGLRLCVRERGSGARRLLEAELRRAGVSIDLSAAGLLAVNGHLEVARAIASGAADAGVATRDAAIAFGLGFIPLAEERYDLALASPALADRRVQRLLDVMASAPFRRELASLGYDVGRCGERAAEILAA